MPSRRELEAALEERCVARVEAEGGLAIKLVIPGVRGFPDRTVLMPGSPVWFAEFKRLKTGRVSAQQVEWHKRLERVGCPVHFIDDDATFIWCLDRYRGKQ